jgi:TRAP-type mannitol/chloroaromatic compound transport system permease small subunit
MQFLMGLSLALDRLNTFIGKVAAWLLIPLVGVIMVDVINRKLHLLTTLAEYLKSSGNVAAGEFVESYLTSTKFQDLEWHLHAALFLLCLGFAYVRNAHVRIELVRERFSPEVKAWLELIGSLIFLLPYATIVLYFSYEFAMRSYAMNEVSASLTGLSHRWIIKSFVPIGMVLLLLAGASVVIRNALFLFGPEEMKERVRAITPELHVAAEELREMAEHELEEITDDEHADDFGAPPSSSDSSGEERT